MFHVKQRYNAVALNRDLGQKPAMSADRRAAIIQFMESRGLKVQPWTLSAGLAEGTLRDFLSGRNTTMTLDKLDRLAAAADATLAEVIGEKLQPPRIGRDMVAIKSLEVRAAMGGGFDVVDEPEGPPIYFRRLWIEKLLDGRPGLLRALELTGESMLPTINDGDIGLVLFPDEETKFQSGKIHAVWDGQGLIVKRLETKVGAERQRLRVISDNRAVSEPYEVDADDVRIIGQVVWRGGRV